MTYLPGLVLVLGGLWFALSGETSPMFLILAAISVWLALWISARLRIIGRDASPYHRAIQLLAYFAWLVGEIVKANIAVIGRVLGPRHAINPDVVRIRTSAKSDLARALFANSITLTPGTVTLDVEGDQLVVHTLARQEGNGGFQRMNDRAARAADVPVAPLPQSKA